MAEIELNPQEAEAIHEIEWGIGHKLPLRRRYDGRLPRGPGEGDKEYGSWDKFYELITFGCFLNPNGNVVGLALASINLENVPLAVLKLQTSPTTQHRRE